MPSQSQQDIAQAHICPTDIEIEATYNELKQTECKYIDQLKQIIQENILPKCEIGVNNILPLGQFEGLVALDETLQKQDKEYIQRAMELLYPYCKTGTHKKCFIGLKPLEPIEIKKRGRK